MTTSVPSVGTGMPLGHRSGVRRSAEHCNHKEEVCALLVSVKPNNRIIAMFPLLWLATAMSCWAAEPSTRGYVSEVKEIFKKRMPDEVRQQIEGSREPGIRTIFKDTMTDDVLQRLEGSREVTVLDLSDSQVTDAGLAHIEGCRFIRVRMPNAV